MENKNDIHYLVQELIPIKDDISPQAQQIIQEHIQGCDSCRELYKASAELEMKLPSRPTSDTEVEVKPLKKLAQFNWGIRALLIAVRVIILGYILFSGFSFGVETGGHSFVFIQGSIYMFYLPAALFSLIFTFIFLPKKWLYSSLIVDLIVIFATDFSMKLILF